MKPFYIQILNLHYFFFISVSSLLETLCLLTVFLEQIVFPSALVALETAFLESMYEAMTGARWWDSENV